MRRAVGRVGVRPRTRRLHLGLCSLAGVLLLAACATAAAPPRAPTPGDDPPSTAATAYPQDIVHVTGVSDVRFGAARQQLAHRLAEDAGGCSVQLTGIAAGNLVFGGDGRLVLLWFDAPLRTPEGVHTGLALDQVQAVYPGATALDAPEGSYRFDGLLVTSGKHGYLFLHDGAKIQKAVAGYTEYLKRLFNTGFGVC